MKKRVFLIIAAAILVFLGMLCWFLGTSSGALWLIKAASDRAGLVLDAGAVQGRLWGELRIEGLRIAWTGGMLRSERLSLRWKPLSLLSGTVSVRRLDLGRVEVVDNSTERRGPPDLTWPRVAGFPSLVDVDIDLLTISRLTYRRQAGPAVEIASLESSVIWSQGALDISVLHVESASARAKGRIIVGLVRPSLSLAAAAALSRPVEGVDGVTVHAVLREDGEKGAQVSGRTTFSATSGTSRVFSCVSEVSVARRSVGIKDLLLVLDNRGGAIRGDGGIDFPGGKARISLKARVYDLDLSRETRFLSHVSGSLGIQGGEDSYRGTFDLANYGAAWREMRLSGAFEGDGESVQFSGLGGELLRGSVGGELKIDWKSGLSLSGYMTGRGLDPSAISPAWFGSVNFDMEAGMAEEEGGLKGSFSGSLRESTLRGVALNGKVRARLEGGEIVSTDLLLQGKDFLISAAGDLREKLSFSVRADDLSALVPDAGGHIWAAGWVRVLKGRAAGSASASGRTVSLDGLRIGSFRASGRVESSEGHPLKFRVDVGDLSYGSLKADSLVVSAKGTESENEVEVTVGSGRHSVKVGLEGEYAGGAWQGRILRFSGRDWAGPFNMTEPSALKISRDAFVLSRLVVHGAGGERTSLSADMSRDPVRGVVSAEWTELDLRHTAWFAPDLNLSGKSNGRVRAEVAGGRLKELAADASASGRMVLEKNAIGFRRASAAMTWNARGMDASAEIEIAEGGMFRGHLTSAAPATLSLPPGGAIDLSWSGIDLAFFRRWIPRDIDLAGGFAGKADGNWTKGGEVQLRIVSSVANGRIHLKKGNAAVGTEIRSAEASAEWRGESMKGNISFDLADHGEASARFAVPLPARLPPEMDRKGRVFLSVHGRAHEKGLLAALFPGLIRESSGDADLSLMAEGRWESPAFSGGMRIEKAGAYFPATGIHVKNVSLRADFDRDTVKVGSFHAESGPGRLDGRAVIRLNGWRPEDYRGNLKGDRFQTFYLPDLRVVASPDLSFEGTAKKFELKGDILVPELLATGSSRKVITQSPDVVLAGPRKKENAKSRLPVDIDIKIILGDHVVVKEQGFDVQLKGSVALSAKDMKEIKGEGQIDIVKGRYATYGVDLDIARGKLLFSGGPADNPALDVLALRKSNDVKAGVLVTGTLNAPAVKLYSEPSMADTDVLAYIVLGHPLGSGSSAEAGLLIRAAGQLLSAGQSVTLQDKIKRTIGLDTLDVESGSGNVARSMVTVGKYLTPKLYISYGRSLFGVGDLFKTRYSLTKKWEVDVSSGAESGADVLYKIEFR
jgi:translocation and assembly module TamB